MILNVVNGCCSLCKKVVLSPEAFYYDMPILFVFMVTVHAVASLKVKEI